MGHMNTLLEMLLVLASREDYNEIIFDYHFGVWCVILIPILYITSNIKNKEARVDGTMCLTTTARGCTDCICVCIDILSAIAYKYILDGV